MTYVMSDLHGEVGKYLRMLDEINFCGRDELYILGDVIDRGDGGELILYTMMKTPNVLPMIGNHESFALPGLKEIRDGKPLPEMKDTAYYCSWAANGGEVTAKGFASLGKDTQTEIIDYIESFSIRKELTVNGKRFHLSHTLPKFDPECAIRDVSNLDFVWGDPDYGVRYDPEVTFITGHTPTALIDPAYAGRIWHGNGHTAIDCGAAFESGRLGCLCLETMEEYYV